MSAMCTESVGVPFTKLKPFAARMDAQSGRDSVSELDAPLQFCSGAITVTPPSGCSDFVKHVDAARQITVVVAE